MGENGRFSRFLGKLRSKRPKSGFFGDFRGFSGKMAIFWGDGAKFGVPTPFFGSEEVKKGHFRAGGVLGGDKMRLRDRILGLRDRFSGGKGPFSAPGGRFWPPGPEKGPKRGQKGPKKGLFGGISVRKKGHFCDGAAYVDFWSPFFPIEPAIWGVPLGGSKKAHFVSFWAFSLYLQYRDGPFFAPGTRNPAPGGQNPGPGGQNRGRTPQKRGSDPLFWGDGAVFWAGGVLGGDKMRLFGSFFGPGGPFSGLGGS